MTDITPEAIARLLEGVTPAPWHADCTDDDVVVWAGSTDQTFVANIGQRIAGVHVAFDCHAADAQFIAAARSLVPTQAARIAELEAEVARLRDILVGYVRRADATARDLRRHARGASHIVDSLEANNARAREAIQEKPHD